jgi:hypothetical protein
MGNGVIKNEREAREVLELPKTGVLDKATIEAAYNRLFRDHQAKKNAWLSVEEFERESKILQLLSEARKICLGISTPSAQPTTQSGGGTSTPPWSGGPKANVGWRRRRRARSGSVRVAAAKLGDVFVHLWLVLKNLFGFVRAIPGAFGEVKDVVCDVLDQLNAAGIPKIVVVVVLILGFLPLLNGCVQFIHKMAGLFK